MTNPKEVKMKTQNQTQSNLHNATPAAPRRLQGPAQAAMFLFMLAMLLGTTRPARAQQQPEDPARVLPEMFKIINDWGNTGPNPSHVNGTLIHNFGQNMTNWLTGWDCASGMVVWAWDPTNLCPGVEIYHTFTNYDANGNQIVWSGEYSGDYPGLWFQKRDYEYSYDDGTTRSWTSYFTDCSFRLLAGGPTNSTDKVLIELDVLVWDNCNWCVVDPTTYYITYTGGYSSLDTNGVAYLGCQDNGQYTFDLTGLPHIPYTGSNYDYSIYITATRHKLKIGVDANRDGSIDLYGTNDLTSATSPHNFWINNDRDVWDSAKQDYYDVDSSTGSDYSLSNISTARDMEDFERIAIRLPDCVLNHGNSSIWSLALQSRTPIKIFYSSTDSRAHVEDIVFAQTLVNQNGTQNPGACLGECNPTLVLPDWLIQNAIASNQSVIYLLVEAGSPGGGGITAQLKAGATIVSENTAWIAFWDITSMYDHYTAGDSAQQGAYVSHDPQLVKQAVLRPQSNDYILFVHGWRMQPWERRRFAETAFKRLWWQNYRGNFGLFSWPTEWVDDSTFWGVPVNMLRDTGNYDRSENQAWASGEPLGKLLAQLNGQYPNGVRLVAHSMGNVVCGEALRQLGTNNVVATYVACQGAVPAHCYDVYATYRALTLQNPVVAGGENYSADSGTRNIFAEYPQPGNVEYFNGNQGANEYVNYYNPDDFALALWNLDQSLKPNLVMGYYWDSNYDFYMSFNSIVRSLDPIADRYEIFSMAAEARCYALGTQQGIGGPFFYVNDLNLSGYSFTGARTHHSAQFNSTIQLRRNFWIGLLGTLGL